jgi:mannose-6-phosphate isomerase-like protein (cupin superfamily)
MKHKTLRFGKGFRVSIGNARSQAAKMVLPPGDCEGGPDNRHKGADQWLFVVKGSGRAIVNGRTVPLRAGSLVLIERGDRHEIRNTGRTALQTVSVYVPPAYRSDGRPLPRGSAG